MSATASAKPKRSPASAALPTPGAPWKIVSRAPSPIRLSASPYSTMTRPASATVPTVAYGSATTVSLWPSPLKSVEKPGSHPSAAAWAG